METENVSGIIQELRDLMENVPFGNSVFQIKSFSASQVRPERKYRHLLLQIDVKVKALEECADRRKKLEIDIEELEYKIETLTDKVAYYSNKEECAFGEENKLEARNKKKEASFEKRRAIIDLEQRQRGLKNEMKLINDAVIEVAAFKDMLNSLPKFTREQFEAAEFEYWKETLTEQAKIQIMATGKLEIGTLESLQKIGLGKDVKELTELLSKPAITDQSKP